MATEITNAGGAADAETSRRWLLKALREASGEMHELFVRALRGGMPDAEALIERAWREGAISAWQLGHMLFRDADELPLRDFEWLDPGGRAGQPDCYEQLREWDHTREQLSSVLYMLSGDEWEQRARHRFRGELSVEAVVRSIHQTDLEILNTLRDQALRDQALRDRDAVQPSAAATSEAARAKFIV